MSTNLERITLFRPLYQQGQERLPRAQKQNYWETEPTELKSRLERIFEKIEALPSEGDSTKYITATIFPPEIIQKSTEFVVGKLSFQFAMGSRILGNFSFVNGEIYTAPSKEEPKKLSDDEIIAFVTEMARDITAPRENN